LGYSFFNSFPSSLPTCVDFIAASLSIYSGYSSDTEVFNIIESVDSTCRDSTDMQCMIIHKILSKSQKR